MKKTQFYKILFLVCFFVCCSIFIVFYEASISGFESSIGGKHYSFLRILISIVFVTIIGASLMGSLVVLYLDKLLRKKPFGLTLLIKTIVFLIFIFIFTSFAIIYSYSSDLGKSVLHKNVINEYIEYLSSATFVMSIVYWGVAILFAFFILQVSEKFGQGVLVNFLRGKYHQPKEENRIFMFMDLKSSTTYAEKLGHIRYSQFIQDCFFDITDIVLKYDAKIYQYVGDEVILSWKISEGLKDANCINTFFAYDTLLKSKSDYYEKKYGIIPEFKAGLHVGTATVAEVGEVKRELAYHGDVLNTAARIQGKCNELQQRLLLSEQIKIYLEKLPTFLFVFLDKVILRGKTIPVNIYGVEISENN